MGNLIERDQATGGTGNALERYGYDRGNIWVDVNSSGKMLARRFYLDGVDQVFARITYAGGGPVGILGYYLTDREGSVVRIMGSSGTIVNTVSYADAYGAGPSNSSSAQADRYEYAGGQYDKDTQLEYDGVRFYDPNTEKWLSQDPLGFAGGDSNLYRYVGDSPVDNVDPSGLFWWEAWEYTKAFGQGLAQGGANLANGVQDAGIGILNTPGAAWNLTAGNLGAPRVGYIPSPDWSKGLVCDEGDTAHAVSKFLGGEGAVTLATVGASKISYLRRLASIKGAPRSIPIVVGPNTATVTVSQGTATVVTDYVQTLTDRQFFAAIIEAARSQGATRMVVNTGAVHEINLAIKLGEAAQRGRTIAGGTVTITSPAGTTQPSFSIIWETIPNVTP